MIVGLGLSWWVGRHLGELAAQQDQQLAKAEQAYTARFEEWLSTDIDPREANDLEFFLSAALLEDIASEVAGNTIRLSEHTTVQVDSLSFDFKRGFPLIYLHGSYSDTSNDISFGGKIAAALELDYKGERIFLRIRPISIMPVFGIGSMRFAFSGLFKDLSQQWAREQLASWEGFELPVMRELPIELPPLTPEVIVKLGQNEGDPWIKTDLHIGELNTDLGFAVEAVVFTEYGIHVFANLDKRGAQARPKEVHSRLWQQFDFDARVDAIAFNSNFGLRLSKRVFEFLVYRLDDLPQASKRMVMQATDSFGDLTEGKAGPIHYRAWLEEPEKTRADMQIDTLSAETSDDGIEIIRYSASGVIAVEGQLGVRAQLGKPKPGTKFYQGLDPSHPEPIGVKFDPKELTLNGRFVLRTDDPTLPIIAIMIDPIKDLELRCRFHIPGFGHITIRPKFDIPESRMTRIKIPLALQDEGTIAMGDDMVAYHIAVKDMQCSAYDNYLKLTANAVIEFGGQ